MDKRRISALPVLIAVAALLASCGQSSEPKSQLSMDDRNYSSYEITSFDVPAEIFSVNKSDENTVVLGLDKDGMLCRYLWANDGFGWFESVATDAVSQDIAVRKADYDKDGKIAAYCESSEDSADNEKYIYKEADDKMYSIDVSDVLRMRCSDTDESVFIYTGENICKYSADAQSDAEKENVEAYTCVLTVEESNVIDLCVKNDELIILTDKGISHYDSETGELKVTDTEIGNTLAAEINRELEKGSQDESNDCRIVHMTDDGVFYLALDDGLYGYDSSQKKLTRFACSESGNWNTESDSICDYIVVKDNDEDETFVLAGSGENENVMFGYRP